MSPTSKIVISMLDAADECASPRPPKAVKARKTFMEKHTYTRDGRTYIVVNLNTQNLFPHNQPYSKKKQLREDWDEIPDFVKPVFNPYPNK